MRWFVLVALVGCKYPDPGFDIPSDDQPPDDAAIDDAPPDDAEPTPCLEPHLLENNVVLPGKMIAGFSPADDESFAISWLSGMNLGYTEGNLGETYSPTNLPDIAGRANLSPDGSTVYFFVNGGVPAGQRMRRSTKNGGNGQWTASIWSGMNEGFPGRPTADDQRMFYDEDLQPTEAMRMAGTWMDVRSYTPEDFGNAADSVITSGNLSPDGNFLVYTLSGPSEDGIHLRVRVGGTFDVDDGAYGRGLASGPYRDAILTANCTHLYAYNTMTQQEERWDVVPVEPP